MVVIQGDQVYVRSAAALRVLAVMDQPWRLGWIGYRIGLAGSSQVLGPLLLDPSAPAGFRVRATASFQDLLSK